MAAKDKCITLPSHLESFRNLLEKSILDAIKIHTSITKPNITQSKIGGAPYLPVGAVIPRDPYGEPMLLLAQINFSQIAFLYPFPSLGLLQFFISSSAHLQATGTNGFISPNLFHIRFLPHVSDFEDSSDIPLHHPPMWQEVGLTFTKEIEPVSLTDYRFSQFISAQHRENFTQQQHQPFDEVYDQYFLAADQKLGGYPYFIDKDFRIFQPEYRQYDTLLFQLVSDDEIDFMWGDCGVLKFFISEQDLQKCHFSNVLVYGESY